ncbi:divalent-cation tolerance protein CutA [Pontibaca salina]|nr:divalent-cation tolerance protein CutA [Pontibaca salina]
MVGTTVASREEARKIASACVEQGLAACAHIDEIESVFFWNDAVQNAAEYRVFLKTAGASYDQVEKLIASLHSYDEPAIFSLPITQGSESYLRWIAENSSGPK